MQFKPVTSGTPEPRSRTPEHPEVVSDNKCFTKVNPDEETSKGKLTSYLGLDKIMSQCFLTMSCR